MEEEKDFTEEVEKIQDILNNSGATPYQMGRIIGTVLQNYLLSMTAHAGKETALEGVDAFFKGVRGDITQYFEQTDTKN